MINIQRENIVDLTNQRFQENTDQFGKKIQRKMNSDISTMNQSITASIANLQSQINAIPASPLSLGYTKGVFLAFNTHGFADGGLSMAHGLGTTPKGWFIAGVSGTGINANSEITGAVDSTNLSISYYNHSFARYYTIYVVA